MIESRPLAVARAIGACVGSSPAYSVWPDFRWPARVVDLRSPGPAKWLAETFPNQTRTGPRSMIRRIAGPRLSAALTARSVLVGTPGATLMQAAELALGRPVESMRIALYSPSGMRISKALHFIFEERRNEPTIVAIIMADPEHSARLRRETEMVEHARARASADPELADSFPPPALLAQEVDGEYVVVASIDPMAKAVGRGCRGSAQQWLRRFQAASSTGRETWSHKDCERELASLRLGWSRLLPESADTITERTKQLIQPHADTTSCCFVHGDFWRGNIAHSNPGEIRVFDWEWAEEDGHPALDLLNYEVGEARLALDSAGGEDDAERILRAGMESVADELESRELPATAGLAFLAPVVGRLAERSHQMVKGPSDPLVRLMRVVERILCAD